MHPFRRFLFVRDVFFQMHHVDHIYLPIYLTISKSIYGAFMFAFAAFFRSSMFVSAKFLR